MNFPATWPGAKLLLEKNAGSDSASAQALAEFLCHHGDSSCRAAYLKWADLESNAAKKKSALHEVVLTDFTTGDETDLPADLKRYNDAGGADLALPAAHSQQSGYSSFTIPGPLPAFARMAALSPDVAPEELLPALARNIVTNGFEAVGNESLQQTEYLRLLTRYVGQARELQAMAGGDKKIVIPACDSEQDRRFIENFGLSHARKLRFRYRS